MMKYYKLNNEVFAFDESDVAKWVKPKMVEMTAVEIDRHLNPQNYLSDEEIAAYNRSLLPVLPKRQFALYLYDHVLYDQVMATLDKNPRFKIEYETVKDIDRLSSTVSAMSALLGWTDEQVDQMWNKALKL